MGIKGTVRRTTDGHLIHANIDTDIIISEEQPTGSTKKPEELYQVIERFAQGTLLVFQSRRSHALLLSGVVLLRPPHRYTPVASHQLGAQLLLCLRHCPIQDLAFTSTAIAQQGPVALDHSLLPVCLAFLPVLHHVFPAGRRRLELFGEDHNIRPGWVTVGSNITSSKFNPQVCAVLLKQQSLQQTDSPALRPRIILAASCPGKT